MDIGIGTVKNVTVAKNRDGENNVRLLDVELSDADDIQTTELYTQAGEDYNPPKESKVFVLSVGAAWKIAIACDDGIEPAVAEGEREIYSSSGGSKQATIYLKNDGTIVITGTSVEINGDADFAVAFDDLKTGFDTLKTQINTFITAYNGHAHAYLPGPLASTNTATPLPAGVAATATIDGAKVPTVKLP